MAQVSRVQALKDFFSVPNKLVTNKELMDFAKLDRTGYTELSELAAEALGNTIKKS